MRPVAWVGLAIMIMAVFAGFQPTLPSILMLFATTLFGGYYIRKNESKEVYDGFVIIFGYMAAIANFVAAGMMMLSPLNYVDKASGAFLSMIVGLVIITLIRANEKKDNEKRD